MKSIYVEVLAIHPAQENGTVYANTVSLDKSSEGQAIQLQSDTAGKFGGEDIQVGLRFSATTEHVMDHNGVPVLAVSKVKKRYKSTAKYSEKDIGMMEGHGMTCAVEYGASYAEMSSTAISFAKLTQKLKKEEANRLGVKETDFNLGQSVGLAVKLAAKSQAGKGMGRVERCAQYFLTKVKEEVGKGIREWVDE